ncbi:phosphatase [Allostella vacuolata]|nr:phosphatase [Stella vacuolata]
MAGGAVRSGLAALAAAMSLAGAAAAETIHPWVVLGPDGAAVVRTATTDAACPRIRYDDFDRPMQVRVGPWQDYPHTVCEAPLPAIVRSVSFAGRPVPVPRPDPQRIVILGDTGCRIRGGFAQACNDPREWPFARLAATAAALKPDLVIHVGDYHYRESPCPQPSAGCEGSPYGYNWPAWRADFFEPAAPLLAAAPWVMVRGNHEDCRRAGHGWYRYLEPRARPVDCEAFTAPYRVTLGDFSLVVLDTAHALDQQPPQPLVDRYRPQIEAARALATPGSWLLAHHPLYAVFRFDGPERRPVETNATLLAAAEGLGPDPFPVVFSGHIHRFDVFRFAGPRPSQVIVGGGGTAVDGALGDGPPRYEIAGMEVAERVSEKGFLFLLLERDGAGWRATLHDVDGGTVRRCRLDGRNFTCPQ